MVDDEWVQVEACPDSMSAEVVAQVLREEGIPVRVESPDIPGLETGSRVLVPAALHHRAAWLLAQSKVTEAELTYLATQTLPGPDETI